MKFIDINSVRGLEIDQPVFVKYNDSFGLGKLIKVEKTKEGTVRTFQIAVIADDYKTMTPLLTTGVTHVCIPK